MDTQETSTRSVNAPEQGNECVQPSIMQHNIDQQDTPVDRAIGETETMMIQNNELEGETNKTDRRHLYDNVRDEDFPKYEHSLTIPSTSRVEMESDGTRRSTGGEVKGKEANGVGSQHS